MKAGHTLGTMYGVSLFIVIHNYVHPVLRLNSCRLWWDMPVGDNTLKFYVQDMHVHNNKFRLRILGVFIPLLFVCYMCVCALDCNLENSTRSMALPRNLRNQTYSVWSWDEALKRPSGRPVSWLWERLLHLKTDLTIVLGPQDAIDMSHPCPVHAHNIVQLFPKVIYYKL